MSCTTQPDNPVVREINRVKGDQIVVGMTLTRTGFDWTGTTARAHVRAIAGGEKLAEFTATLTPGATGTATLSLVLDGTATAALPSLTFADVEVVKTSASFGPHTPVRLKINLQDDITP